MRLTTELWLSTPREEVFRAFRDASTLEVLSPPWVHCRTLTPAPAEMKLHAVIDYRLRLRGIPFRWRAAVTAWDPPRVFVDEQRRGPYRRWIHTHTFVEHRGGTLLGDVIEFNIPCGVAIGSLVEHDLRRVFTFRHQALLRFFNQPPPWPESVIVVSS